MGGALGLAACGSEPSGPSGRGPQRERLPLQRLALALEGSRAESTPPRTVKVLHPAEASWERDGLTEKPEQEASGGFSLGGRASGALELRWEGDLDRTGFQRVRILAEASAATSCSMHLFRSGKAVFDSPAQSLLPEQREVAFELPPPAAGEATRVDALVLRIFKPDGSWRIQQAVLQEVPATNYLPVDTEVHWVRLHEDARRARSLWVGETWYAKLDLGGPSRLLLGVGRPLQADRGGALFLELELRNGRERHERRIDLAALLGREEAWSSATYPLGPPAGPAWKAGQVEIELRLSGEAGGAIALETPIVDRVRRDSPVVVLVTSDTHRADHVASSAPAGPARTPVLDAWLPRASPFAMPTPPPTTPSPAIAPS